MGQSVQYAAVEPEYCPIAQSVHPAGPQSAAPEQIVFGPENLPAAQALQPLGQDFNAI
jgi:hypothetical protein